MPSTKDLSSLPAPIKIRHACKCSAMLDVVLCDQQWLRCYDYQPKWSSDVAMAKYDNGGGNHMFVFCRGEDAIIKGFDHESPVSRHASGESSVWPGIYAGVPAELDSLLDDAAVERDDVTFCIWYTAGQWHHGTMEFRGDEDDSSSCLLDTIHLDPGSYCFWARSYYEREIDSDLVASIYSGTPIRADVIAALNPDRDVTQAMSELSEMAAS